MFLHHHRCLVICYVVSINNLFCVLWNSLSLFIAFCVFTVVSTLSTFCISFIRCYVTLLHLHDTSCRILINFLTVCYCFILLRWLLHEHTCQCYFIFATKRNTCCTTWEGRSDKMNTRQTSMSPHVISLWNTQLFFSDMYVSIRKENNNMRKAAQTLQSILAEWLVKSVHLHWLCSKVGCANLHDK